MSISNSESRTAKDSPRTEHSTALRAGSVGVMGILFFVLSAQAPLTGIVGASPLAVALGNGAGAPGRVSGGGHRDSDLRRRVRRDEPQDPGQRRLLRLCHGRLWAKDRSRSGVARTPRVQHGPGRDVRAVRRGVLGRPRNRRDRGSLVAAGRGHHGGRAGAGISQHRTRGASSGSPRRPGGRDPAHVRLHRAVARRRTGRDQPGGILLSCGDRRRRPGSGHHVRCRFDVRLRIHGHLLGRSQGRPPHGGPCHVSFGGGHLGVLLLHFVDAGQLLRPLARH